jgi:5-bromo-4-chloroindolyl phosphate hydrolysis protein
MSKMSKSDKKLLCWLVGTLFVLILLGIIFGVSSVRESFTERSCNLENLKIKEVRLLKKYKSARKNFNEARKNFNEARKNFNDCLIEKQKRKQPKEEQPKED